MLEKIKEFFKNKINLKISISILFIIILLFCIISAFVRSGGYKSDVAKQIDYYYYTWSDFKSLSGKSLHEIWNNKYHDSTYQLNGDAKYNQYDCTSSIYWLMKDLKSNFPLMSVNDLQKYLEFVSEKRKGYNDIQTTDLMILYINNAWHIAIVEGKKNGTIHYMDINTADNGVGYKSIAFDKYTIKGVYPVTFSLWIGNLLYNVK